ncbi:hypothetical protein V8F33_004602 [Rhypophila sp. PSN 637]
MVDYSKWDNLEVSDDSDAKPQSSSSKTNTAAPSSGGSQAPTTTTSSKPDNASYISQALAAAGMGPSYKTNPDPPTQEASNKDEEKPRLSPTLQEYANIHLTNYRSSHEFLTSHPSLIDKSTNSDGLLMKEAFLMALQLEDTDEDPSIRALNAKEGRAEAEQTETEKNEIKELVKQCVHQALLLQYCRLVSPDGKDQSAIGGFFMRLIMPGGYGGSAAGKKEEEGRQRELLMADVETRAGEIIELAKEARAEQLRERLAMMMLQGKA